MVNLKKMRDSKGLTRKYVAEKLGVSPDHLNNLERGATQMKVMHIKKLSNIYGVPFTELSEIALLTFESRNQ